MLDAVHLVECEILLTNYLKLSRIQYQIGKWYILAILPAMFVF